MSKFNNPARALGPSTAPVASQPAFEPFRSPTLPPPGPPSRPAATSPGAKSAIVETPILRIGFYSLCAFLLSLYLNDWSFRLVGSKAYLSTVCVVLVPAILLACGRALAGLQDKAGIWWASILLLMVMGVPFSFWRTGSLVEVANYAFRALPFFFFVVAFATNIKRCRNLTMLSVVTSVIVVISCIFFGGYDPQEGRFVLPNSAFFSNSNELGLQLLLGVCALLYLFYSGGMFAKLFAVAMILVSLTFMLKTGSRGCLISAFALLLTTIIFSKQRVMLAAASVPAIVLVFMFAPAASLHRLALIFAPSNEITYNDIGALASTAQRKQLLRKSVEFTFSHPVLGVGMGQFSVAYSGDAEKTMGQHGYFLGSHNSYTQVSSECGIPAFLCYMGILGTTLSRSLRIHRRARGRPRLHDIEALSFCLFATAITYSVATFFFHMAYTLVLPLLSGQVTALHYVTEPLLREAETRS